MGISANASAQKAEIQVSYGGFTQMDCMGMHDDWRHVHTAWGALTAGVNFKIAPKFWIGPSYTFSSTCTDGGRNASHIAYHVLMFNARYEYLKIGIVNLYAHVGLGADISYMMPNEIMGMDNYSKGYFAFQLSPIGANVNFHRNVAFFAELGFGAQGLGQLGFRFAF